MTAIVRVFTHSSLIAAPVSPAGGRFTSDSVSQLKQPYLAKEKITVDTVTPISTVIATAPSKTRLAFIQVQPGHTVHYEITADNQPARTASTSSPFTSGETLVEFGEGWLISFLEFSDT